MANGKIKGKQIEDESVSLDKLSGSGSLTIASASAIQITGTATSANDIVTFKQIQDLGGSITVREFGGASYSNVEEIMFRGGSVTTIVDNEADAVLVGPGSESSKVVVWIPAPSYVDYLSISNKNYEQRFIAEPNSEGDPYYVGSLTTSTPENVTNQTNYDYPTGDFGYFNDNATFSISIYDYNDSSVLDQIIFNMSEITGPTSSSGGAIDVTVGTLPTDDADRRMANLTFNLNHSSFRADGGQFRNEIIFENSELGGAGSLLFSQTYFYDTNNSTASYDFAGGGTISIAESSPEIKHQSGVAYYNFGSTFTFSVLNIDNLNDRSFPTAGSSDVSDLSTGHQLRVDPENLLISNVYYAGVVGGDPTVSDFINWSNSYNQNNLDYIVGSTINQTGYRPDITSNNLLNLSNLSYLACTLWDWSTVNENSKDYKYLINSLGTPASDYNTENFTDESLRVPLTSPNSSPSYPSSSALGANELQVIFGKLIFPQEDFTTWLPQENIDNNIADYSTASGANYNFDIFNSVSTPVTFTSNVSINGYRWYVRSFGRNDTYSQATGSGQFNITGTRGGVSLSESDLGYEWTGSGYSAANGYLQLLVGIDSTGNNTTADRWIWLSGDGATYGGRNNPSGINMGSGQISFTLDSLPNTYGTITRVWLAIGFQDSVEGKKVNITSIEYIGS
jgi:hypothetical protein